eukprot:jgi/Hompol1/871/HPOL_004034-RA
MALKRKDDMDGMDISGDLKEGSPSRTAAYQAGSRILTQTIFEEPLTQPEEPQVPAAVAAYGEDGESDFCPSDAEGAEPRVSRTLTKSDKEKYARRVEQAKIELIYFYKTYIPKPHMGFATEPVPERSPQYQFSDVTPAIISKFNVEKQRWVKKGPAAVYLLEVNNRYHLVAHYLHGDKTLAIDLPYNLKLEVLDCSDTFEPRGFYTAQNLRQGKYESSQSILCITMNPSGSSFFLNLTDISN